MPDLGNLEKSLGFNPTAIKLRGTEPQNTEQGIMNVEVLKNTSYFDITCSIFKEHDYSSTH
jgi:hypothetical protein